MSWNQNIKPNYRIRARKGWCLNNVCRVFGGPWGGYFPSAKYAWAVCKNKHRDTNFPTGVAVPVYCDTKSIYEHVVISMGDGRIWDDGRIRSKANFLSIYKVFGWSPDLCNRTVATFVQSVPSNGGNGFLPRRGYWRQGDTDVRIGRLALFMRKTFPSYTSKAALGNYFGQNIKRSITEFQKRTGLQADGCVGPITLAKLKGFGFNG